MKTWQTPSSTVGSAANATCYNLTESDYLPAPSTSTAMSLNHQRLTAADEHKKIRFCRRPSTVVNLNCVTNLIVSLKNLDIS